MANNEWGDFQTPRDLADLVLSSLPPRQWTRVLEPTCGVGNFLAATERFARAERIGIEVRSSYAASAIKTGAMVICGNIFDMNLPELSWRGSGPMLVVGNPPWVTNAELGSLNSINLPQKSNLKNLKGIDALTGASNFDIAEYILLKLAIELANQRPTIAMLCKTQVARNVLEFAHRAGLPIEDASVRRIDAKRWFGASVDACLFTFTVGDVSDWTLAEFSDLVVGVPERRMGFVAGRFVGDLDAHRRAAFVDGVSPFEWRQGVKHDAASVMELTALPDGQFRTRDGRTVSLELDWIFPLLKCTDLHHGRVDTRRAVIVTQRALTDDVSALASAAPQLWGYLEENAPTLDSRKSSIYRGRPRFAMFGIGGYTFAPWKVAVSGLHRDANFRLVGPIAGSPVVLDDTCYLLPFEDGRSAAITTALLRMQVVTDLLTSITSDGAKRPITKRVLQRIDLTAVASAADADDVCATASLILGETVSQSDFVRYAEEHFMSGQLALAV